MKYEQITREELMALSKSQFIERCLEWNRVFNDGELMKVEDPSKCPVHIWVAHNDAFCMHDVVANTAVCPVCGLPCCPDCHSHHVTQISRVTGYLSDVSGWNASKLEEFKDRQRVDTAYFS